MLASETHLLPILPISRPKSKNIGQYGARVNNLLAMDVAYPKIASYVAISSLSEGVNMIVVWCEITRRVRNNCI